MPAGADISLLPLLGDEDLKQMGVATLGARKRILLGAAELAAGPAGGPSAAAACARDPGLGAADDAAAGAPAEGASGAGCSSAAAEAAAAAAQGAGAGPGVGDWRVLSGTGGATLFCGNIKRYFQPDGRCGAVLGAINSLC